MESYYKNEIQKNIQNPGRKKRIQRAFGIPNTTQDGCAEIIQCNKWQPQQIDTKIQNRTVCDLAGGMHPIHQRLGQELTAHHDSQTKQDREQDRGMNRF